MTPKEKAEELVGKFNFSYNVELTIPKTKYSAIIAVDEILKIPSLKNQDYKGYFNDNSEFINYWEEVKHQLNKI